MLASRFFELQGHPAQYKEELPEWAERFACLAKRYGVANLSAYVEFGFTEDDFWPTKLVRYKTHPLDYFEGKLEQIKTKYQQRLAEKKAEANAKERNNEQQQQQQSRPTAQRAGKQPVDNQPPPQKPSAVSVSDSEPKSLADAIIDNLTLLAMAYNEPLTPERIEVYTLALAGLTPEQLHHGFNRAIRELKFWPRPAELLEMCTGCASAMTDKLTIDLAWNWTRNYIEAFGVPPVRLLEVTRGRVSRRHHRRGNPP